MARGEGTNSRGDRYGRIGVEAAPRGCERASVLEADPHRLSPAERCTMRTDQRLHRIGLVAAALAACLASRAQQPASNEPKLEERVVVQLVQIPFSATDRQGRAVTDLKKEEIKVKLRG